jgi:hypothetical protein
MKSTPHLPTLRGLGPDDDAITDDDIVEVDGERPPMSGGRYAIVTVPPSRPSRPSGDYSLFPARKTRGNGDV